MTEEKTMDINGLYRLSNRFDSHFHTGTYKECLKAYRAIIKDKLKTVTTNHSLCAYIKALVLTELNGGTLSFYYKIERIDNVLEV